jgi:dolichyl-phosphate beta-glucosyltransferase
VPCSRAAPTGRIDAAKPWLEIVVPARNEQNRLPTGLAGLCAAVATLPPGVTVIVVDSASTDETGEIARAWPAGDVQVRLVRCDQPGKGAAVRAGLLATTAPYVGFCDADMATDPAAIPAAVGLLRAGHTVVLGSRSHPESDVEDRHTVVRRVGATAFRALTRVLVPDVSDTQCGFKFFDGVIARAAVAELRVTGFAFDVELIARCVRLGATPVEIPVRWRDVGGSTFSVWRHSASSFAELAIAWQALRLAPTAADRVRSGWAADTPVASVALNSLPSDIRPG